MRYWESFLNGFSQPQLFLKVIDTCEVLKDDGESILREVKFKDSSFLPSTLPIFSNTKISRWCQWHTSRPRTKDQRKNHTYQAHLRKFHLSLPSHFYHRAQLTKLQKEANSGLETFDTIGSANRVLNIVSAGLEGELYLTFTFEWDHPELDQGSEEVIEQQKVFQGSAPKAVAGMLVEVRKMVEEGRL